ncbi:MAG: hypothetical protein AAF460_17855, partial [Pseudomonadota bacterium]
PAGEWWMAKFKHSLRAFFNRLQKALSAHPRRQTGRCGPRCRALAAHVAIAAAVTPRHTGLFVRRRSKRPRSC